MDESQGPIDETKRGVDKLLEDNEAWEKGVVVEANELDQKGNEYYSTMQQNSQEADATTQRTKDVIKQEKQAYMDEWESLTNEALSEIAANNQETEQEAVQKR